VLHSILGPVFKKVVGIPFTFGAGWLSCGVHSTRYEMYRTLANVLKDSADGAGKKVLSISQSSDFVHILGLKVATIIEANYPEHNAINLKAFSDEEFDFVVSDQVLEHVEGNPQLVFRESLRLLKPGGIAVHATCFIYPIHESPSDFWRFTPDCLKYLARDFSEILNVGGFGNRGIWILDFLGLLYFPVPHARWHPLHIVATKNNLRWPTVTWIVARK
jgi:SAM-dependent methyltransferase